MLSALRGDARNGPDFARRLAQVIVGLAAFGFGIALMARAELGLGPWPALHDGIGQQLGLPLGTVEVLLGIPILAAWIPLRQRPGVGTVISAFLLGLCTNAGLDLVPPASEPSTQVALMIAGTATVGLGSALYLSAGLGPGARDGLMTGLQARFGWHIAPVRTGIEVTALVVGALLGGAIGPGTVAYAITIGPVLAILLRAMGAGHMVRRQGPVPAAVELTNAGGERPRNGRRMSSHSAVGAARAPRAIDDEARVR